MQEIEINGKNYRVGRLNAIDQWHVFRKLAPVLSGLGQTFSSLPSLSDDDTEYVLRKCLAACTRHNGDQWSRISAPNGAIMFDDLDMMQMIRLTVEVLRD